ncbi:MAG: hydroxyisourate hydrolase [Rhizobiaceae bacterium]
MAMISSHTLNGADGTHAGGIAVRVTNLNTGRIMLESATDKGGRLSERIDLGHAAATDRYEMVFATADYWAQRMDDRERIIDEVVFRFSMPDPDARYHLPLILSPNSYSCWMSVAET